MSKLTLGSLFSGSGGFELGAILSGIEPKWASELAPFPIRVTTKRLPQVKHLGDITKINGAEIEPVDIITFGSPCQNLSIAGNRKGLDGEKSSLFHEAIRIAKEMREKTNGKQPRFIVFENVCGAFSSNKGQDFHTVLEAICHIKDEKVTLPQPKKWQNAGRIMADNFSLAWRVLDAQYWGVPQRRKRIYLVADFRGECADKILFESESVSGYLETCQTARESFTRDTGESSGSSSEWCLNDQGGQRMDVTKDITATLRATSNHPPLIFENHAQDSRFTGPLETAQTVSATYGTGGNNQPFVVEEVKTFDVRFTSEGTQNARANVYESDTSRTIDTSGNTPDGNHGGIAVVSLQGSMIGRSEKNGPQGSGVGKVGFTLNTVDKHVVAYSLSKNSHLTTAIKEKTGTLVATDYKEPPVVNDQYIVRRLIPNECAKLQGFPPWWCSDLETENPTEDLLFWREVFETYRLAVKPNVKPKTDKQILKWLKNPHSDSAEYKLWGNGVALPNVIFVLCGINYFAQKECL